MRFKKQTVYKWIPILLSGVVLFLFACRLSQDEKIENTISFNSIYDSLATYDSVLITLKAPDGHTIDVVYRGKVDAPSDIENLSAPHWDGGKVIVSVQGFNAAGQQVYKSETSFNGADNSKDSTHYFQVPGESLTSLIHDLHMVEGDSLVFPAITVNPATLADKSLGASSSNPEVLLIGATFVKALKPGSADLVFKLNSNSSISVTIHVLVDVNGRIPELISLLPETLTVAVNGSPGHLSVKATPSGASNTVTWNVNDGAIVSIASDGSVLGLKKGGTWIHAISILKASVSDSSWILVEDPKPVESVHFLKSPIDLYVNGASDSLIVEVLPVLANQGVDFFVSDSTKIAIKNGRVSGLTEGTGRVVAKSKENPSKSDTLRVNILPAQSIDSVRISPRSLKLFTGGESKILTGAVYPSASTQKVQWGTNAPLIVAVDNQGKVSAIGPGKAKVFAISSADNRYSDSADVTVKRDPPVLSVGQDTAVALGTMVSFLPTVAPQEYGAVVQFKYDLNGDDVWDDSATSLKEVSYKYDLEKEYRVRFYVKDTEGNDTIATKAVKAVKGMVVLIRSPLANSSFNKKTIGVVWSINGVDQDSLKSETLANDGANTITRRAKDTSGAIFSTSITVYYDTLSPNKPLVHGPASTLSTTPTWTWATGGAGGGGIYRVALDAGVIISAVEFKDTTYTAPTDLKEGIHTLFVQERDAAGNWSASGSLALRIDLTPPGKPEVKLSTPAVTNIRKPIFTWASGGGGNGLFQSRLDNLDFTTTGPAATDTSFASLTDMAAGSHTLYVRERDSAGNWSPVGSASVTLDYTAPSAPKVNGSAITNTNPKWTWVSGGNGGSGDYRWKQDNADFTTGAAETRDSSYTLNAFANGAAYTLYVQERDAAGNWSASASFTINVNLSGPSSPIVSVAPGPLTNNSSPKWTWKSGGGGVKQFQYRLDNADLSAGTATTDTTLTAHLTNGTHSLYVREKDSGNNWGAVGSSSVTVDTIAPATPNVSAVTASPTLNTKPIWKWTSGGGGKSFYRYKVNDENWASGASQGSVLTYTSDNALAEGVATLYVQEQDSAGNWSASGNAKVTIDLTPPGKPNMNTLSPISPVSSLRPTWSWTSGGNGGAGNYRVRMNNGDMTIGTTVVSSPATSYTPTSDLAEGNNTLYVQESDSAGNWSSVSSRIIYEVRKGQLGGIVSDDDSPLGQLVVNSAGTPFVYCKVAGSQKAVKTFNGTGWVSTGLSGTPDVHDVLQLNPVTNFPEFFDASGSDLVVKTYNGSTWDLRGPPTLNWQGLSYASMSINKQGRPLLVYFFPGDSVMRIDRNVSTGSWIQEFPQAVHFSTDISSDRMVFLLDTASNTPYVMHESGYFTSKVYIMSYQNSQWIVLSNAGLPLSTNYPDFSSFKVSPNGTLFLALQGFYDGINLKESVYRYNGSGWVPYGAEYFSNGHTTMGSSALAFDTSGEPVVAFAEDGKVSLYNYSGSWKKMASVASIASGAIGKLSLTVTPNNVAYVGIGGSYTVVKTGFDP